MDMYLVKLVVFCGVISMTSGIEPISAIGAIGTAVVAGIYTVFTPIKCHFQECCTSNWINLNITEPQVINYQERKNPVDWPSILLNFIALREDLEGRLYGQHLVTNVVTRHLKSHMTREPSRALALSFHGGTGTGKNYVSKIIAESIYKRGMKSKYVHLISATKEYPHEDMVPLYKDKLRELVEKSVKECAQSLFIFDEIDKMPPGIIDTLKPYLDYYEQLAGIDYRNAMFLFLSNTAGEEITKHALTTWQSQSRRDDIGLNEMERIISKATINTETSGMYHSDLIIKHLITAYVPFLPMERKHIRECIKDFLVAKNYYKRQDISEEAVRKISKELNYHPADLEVYSVTGCKRVPEKVDYVMEDYQE